MTALTGQELADEIENRYPHPVAWNEDGSPQPGEYSVGGAACAVIDPDWARDRRKLFPSAAELGAALRKANPCLSSETAWNHANDILVDNDAGEFDGAWYLLAEALKDTGKC